MEQQVSSDPSPIDYLHEITGDAATFVSIFQGRPVNIQGVPTPQLSVGVTGQSGLLIVLGVVVIAAVWIATKK